MLFLNLSIMLLNFFHLRDLLFPFLFGHLFLIVLVDLHENCEEDQEHADTLQIVDLMSKMDDVDNYGEAFPCCDHEGWDMLLEELYHAIDNQLTQSIQD